VDQVVAVLVIPAGGDPGGLLAAGRCGGTPACVYECCPPRGPAEPLTWTVGWWNVAGTHSVNALPLWWDGALVPEGWDRARRVFYAHGPAHDVESIKRGPGTNPPLSFVEEVAPWFVECGLASRVVRLARVDGRLVEVSP
jgi:hypothetical protein